MKQKGIVRFKRAQIDETGRWNDEKHLSSAGFLFPVYWKNEKHASSNVKVTKALGSSY
jgi:hypothetical protein